MAILWDQRDLIRKLQQLEDEGAAELFDNLDKKNRDFIQQTHYEDAESIHSWVLENKLINRLIKEARGAHKITEIRKIKKILNACIRNQFIIFKENEHFKKTEDPFRKDSELISSKRFLQVSEDKGLELLDWRYFWFKYIPETFPQPAGMIINISAGVLTSLLTSGAIWLYIINHITT